MKNLTTFENNYSIKKHPFKIEKELNDINRERKNRTSINQNYENQFKKQFKRNLPYLGDIQK
jgi:hypothetical protein